MDLIDILHRVSKIFPRSDWRQNLIRAFFTRKRPWIRVRRAVSHPRISIVVCSCWCAMSLLEKIGLFVFHVDMLWTHLPFKFRRTEREYDAQEDRQEAAEDAKELQDLLSRGAEWPLQEDALRFDPIDLIYRFLTWFFSSLGCIWMPRSRRWPVPAAWHIASALRRRLMASSSIFWSIKHSFWFSCHFLNRIQWKK